MKSHQSLRRLILWAIVMFLVICVNIVHVAAQNITDAFNYTVNAPISNYSGWSVPNGSAIIANQYVHSSSRSLRLVGGLQTEARRELGGAGNAGILFVELWIRPVVYDGVFETAIAVDGSLIGFTKDGAIGKIMVSNGETSEGAEIWEDSGHRFWMNRDGCTASNWLRIGIRQDSVNGYWDLYVDGKMFLGNIAFKGRGLDPGSLVLWGGSLPADVYVDDVKIWTSNPIFTDADKDGMADSFENAHSFDTGTDDRESASSVPDTTRIQLYLNETHDWFVGQWAQISADTDADGMPDSWELFFGLDPNNAADGGLDIDGDGVENALEYLLGTCPVGNYIIKDIGAVMSAYGPQGTIFQPAAVNNLGDIVGTHYNKVGSKLTPYYGILHASGTFDEIFSPTESVQPRGLLSINDNGQVLGYYKPLTPDNAPMFWWDGDVLNAVALPQTHDEVVDSSLIGTVDIQIGDSVTEYSCSANAPVFNATTNEYDWSYTLDSQGGSLYMADSDSHENVYLVETQSLLYTSSFVGLTNAGQLIGTYTSDFSHFFDAMPSYTEFSSYASRERHSSSGRYQIQLPVDGQAESYLQFPQNNWSGTAYTPVDVNCLGAMLGTAKTYIDGSLQSAAVYLESVDGIKTEVTHPDSLPLTPLKMNRLDHALLKVTGSSPDVFGLAKGGAWVPLNYTLPSTGRFTPVGIDDSDVVAGNSTVSGFGPALLSERGIVRLANVVAEGNGWDFSRANVVDVSDSGFILGTARKLGHSGPDRCFMMWRNDDQDEDEMPDDWERLIIAADTSGLLNSLVAVLPGGDADGDGLNNLDEYLAGTDPNIMDFNAVSLEVHVLASP